MNREIIKSEDTNTADEGIAAAEPLAENITEIESAADRHHNINPAEFDLDREEKISQIRESIFSYNTHAEKSEFKSNTGAVFSDEYVNRTEKMVSRDDFLSKFKELSGIFLSKLGAKKKNENSVSVVEALDSSTRDYPRLNLLYNPGDGIVGMSAREAGIMARGFMDCSAIVFQTKDRVAIIHVSPRAIQDGHFDSAVSDHDIYGHIKSVLKNILNNGSTDRSRAGTAMSNKDLEQIQILFDRGEIGLSILTGEDRVGPDFALELNNMAGSNKIPIMKPKVYNVSGLGGGGGHSVFATPKDVFFIGSNNVVKQRGVDFTPEIVKYLDK
jgi:hypothetical protein